MSRSSKKLPIISFFIYVGVIILLVYLALFARGFSFDLGGIRLSGRFAPLPLMGERKLWDLTVSSQGLDISFSHSRPITVGDAASFRLDSIKTYSEGADILFEGGGRIHLTAEGKGGVYYSLTVTVPTVTPGRIALSIPFKVKGEVTSAKDAPVLTWKQGSGSCALSLPSGSRIDKNTGTLYLSPDTPGTQATISMGSVEPSLDSPYAVWLTQEATRETAETMSKKISEFLDAAYAGWIQGRVSADGTLWKMADGSYGFSENICTSVLAESIPRGAYTRNRQWIQQAVSVHIARFPQAADAYSASPYIGGLKEYTGSLQAGETAEVERLRGLLSSQNPSLLSTPYPLIPFLLDHGPFSLVQDAFAFVQDTETSELDTASALGMLEALLDYSAYVERTETCLARCREVIGAVLIPAIKQTDKGLFLTGESGSSIDVALDLRAASLLLRAGSELSIVSLESIGRSLMAAITLMRRDQAFLPSSMRISQDRIAGQEGSLASEEVYRYLVMDRYVPSETPISKSLGPGAWIWSVARMGGVDAFPDSFILKFSFPVGLPHYMAIQGVKPFSQIMLHGTAWRSDPAYASYSDGWTFDAKSSTLFLKLTGREEMERIVITY
jgi:hypothetical protein